MGLFKSLKNKANELSSKLPNKSANEETGERVSVDSIKAKRAAIEARQEELMNKPNLSEKDLFKEMDRLGDSIDKMFKDTQKLSMNERMALTEELDKENKENEDEEEKELEELEEIFGSSIFQEIKKLKEIELGNFGELFGFKGFGAKKSGGNNAGSEAANSGRSSSKHEPSSYTHTLLPKTVIRNIQENFTEEYPYLRLGIYMVKTGQKADKTGGTISSFHRNSTLSEVRSFKGECKIEINTYDTPQELEKRFRSVSGLVVKVCYNDENDHRYYISTDSPEYKMKLADINKKFKEAGYKTADIS